MLRKLAVCLLGGFLAGLSGPEMIHPDNKWGAGPFPPK